MTQSRFFQISLLFPFALWCLCLLLFSLVYKEGAAFILGNLFNACRVFVPYLIFAAVVWRLAGNKTYRLLILMALVIPIIWGAFFTSFYVVMTLITQHMTEQWHILCIMAFWATLVAYLFEIIPLLIFTIFKDDLKSGSTNSGDKTSGGQQPVSMSL
jgi:hypothetical protein